MSQKIDWWITSWCHCGGLVTISEMMVSACLHRSVIDYPNPKHSPLSTSYDGTLDWNHSGWGGVWAICYLLHNSPRPPSTNPLPTPPSIQPPPAAARVFATTTHYGNQTVCVYRNQSTEKPISRVMTRQNLFVTFDLWGNLPLFFLDRWGGGLQDQ